MKLTQSLLSLLLTAAAVVGRPQDAAPASSSSASSSVSTSASSTASSSAPSASASSNSSSPAPLTLQQCQAMMDNQLPSTLPYGFNYSSNVRSYYVAAEEVLWDYAPTGWDNWLGVPFNDSPRAMTAGYVDAGTKWWKAAYVGYQDQNFTQKTPLPAFHGLQGPTLRAEVGDMIQILFTNKLNQSQKYASMHSMGLVYSKDEEGSDYTNTTTGGNPAFNHGEAVPVGGCYVYKWLVGSAAEPEQGVPAKLDAYHSYVDFQADTNAGLIGPTYIYAKGNMTNAMSNTREFPFQFNVFDETLSFMAEVNAKYKNISAGSPMPVMLGSNFSGNQSFWMPQLTNMPTITLNATSAPQWYSVNGWVFANNPAFEMCQGEQATWGIYGYSGMSHAFHLHGHSVYDGQRNSVTVDIQDGVMRAALMEALSVGVFQALCHVTDHQAAGMIANYRVYAQSNCPLASPLQYNTGNTTNSTRR